ncbi:MAG: hypothetical protein P8H97_00290 [Pseudomonadales bacterium]|nr:hypothetical protein [Pseudomonadales bacterium]
MKKFCLLLGGLCVTFAAHSAVVSVSTPSAASGDPLTYSYAGQSYGLFENITSGSIIGSNASGEELIWLGAHQSWSAQPSAITINLTNENGGNATGGVSLVLSSANVNNWDINVEAGVQLNNVFIIALGSESQTVEVNGENGAFAAGDDGLIAGVNILRSSTTSSCGYEFPSSDPSQGCDTEVTLGLEFDSAFSKVNILETMQSGSGAPLELTSFNGSYYVDNFDVGIDSVIPVPASGLLFVSAFSLLAGARRYLGKSVGSK